MFNSVGAVQDQISFVLCESEKRHVEIKVCPKTTTRSSESRHLKVHCMIHIIIPIVCLFVFQRYGDFGTKN